MASLRPGLRSMWWRITLLCLTLLVMGVPLAQRIGHSAAMSEGRAEPSAMCTGLVPGQVSIRLAGRALQFRLLSSCIQRRRSGTLTLPTGARHVLPAGSILQATPPTSTATSQADLATTILDLGTPTDTPVASIGSTGTVCIAGSTQQVAQAVEPGVVKITVAAKAGQRIGTGFVIGEDTSGTYVLTGLSLVQGAAPAQISVTAPVDGKIYGAQVMVTQPAKSPNGAELALLRLQPTLLPALPWGDSRALALGQSVISIGYAAGEGGPPSVLQGLVVAVGRDLHDTAGPIWIEHQTSIDPDGAGGPLLDLSGSVVGVNLKQKFAILGKNQTLRVQGIFFALPARMAAKEARLLLAALRARHVPQPIAVPTVASTATATASATPSQTATVPTSTATTAGIDTPTPVVASGTTYTGVGYTLTEPPGWIVKSLKDGTPVLLSADQYVGIIVQESLASQAPTSDQVKEALGQIAQSALKEIGGQVTTTYTPITIGAMTGLTATLTASDGSITVLISLVSDGTHVVLVQESLNQGATPQDSSEANVLTQSITPTN